MHYFFRILSSLIFTYSMLCIVRIILTWLPGSSLRGVQDFLSKITDPYLNLFKGIPFMRMGSFDFSPALALACLALIQSLFSSLASAKMFSLSGIIILIINMIFQVANAILGFFILLLIIRLIVLLVRKNYYASPLENAIDQSVSPLVYKLSRIFTGGRASYKKSLIIAIIVLLVFQLFLTALFVTSANLIGRIGI